VFNSEVIYCVRQSSGSGDSSEVSVDVHWV